MPDRFDICHPITAAWEGGWSDHKADPGGKTMYGITEAVYHAWLTARRLKIRPVRNISKAEALLIYREQYWKPTVEQFDLFPGVDLAVYDASVNSGVSRGIKWMKSSAGSNDHSTTVKKICRARLGFMQSLAIWKSFGKGWGRRVADIEARGVAMALAAMGASSATIAGNAKREAESSTKSASTANKAATATATGAAGSGATVVQPGAVTDTTSLWLLGATCAAAILITIVLLAKKRAAKARADAYEQTATEVLAL